MFNKAFLLGNLGRDPEVRTTEGGATIANLSLATNRRYTDQEGQRHEQTEWHNIVCFGRLAEIAAQYLKKGRPLFVEGRIQTRSWEDRQTGDRRYRTEVVCHGFQMLGPGNGDGATRTADGDDVEVAGDGAEPEDDDIPF